MKIDFFRLILDNIQILIFTKICPLGDELIHAEGKKDENKKEVDMMKSRVAFAIFRTRLKITFTCEESNLNPPEVQQVASNCNVRTSRQRAISLQKQTLKRSSHPSEEKHMSSKSPLFIIHIRVYPDPDIFFTWSQSGCLRRDTRSIWSYCRPSCWQSQALNHILSPNYQPKPSDTRY